MLIHLTGAAGPLEIGAFTGYGALAVASALPPDGRLVTCDVSEEWTRIARRYWNEAGIAKRIELHPSGRPSSPSTPCAGKAARAFDFAFIDADKENLDPYYEACLGLVRPGGLIAVDNVLWHAPSSIQP